MGSNVTPGLDANEVIFLAVTVGVAAGASLAVFIACFYWFRREQRRWQKKMLRAIAESNHGPEDLIVTGQEAITYGELIAQFKVNQGKQVVSVLESDGKRFHSRGRRAFRHGTDQDGPLPEVGRLHVLGLDRLRFCNLADPCQPRRVVAY